MMLNRDQEEGENTRTSSGGIRRRETRDQEDRQETLP